MCAEADVEEKVVKAGEECLPVENLGNVGQQSLKQPFLFNGVECRTNREVGEVLAKRWENAKELLYTGALGEFYGEQDYGIASEIRWIVSHYKAPDKKEGGTATTRERVLSGDVGLSRLLLLLNDGEALVWRGKKYASFGEISQAIAAHFENASIMMPTLEFTGLLSSEILSYWNDLQLHMTERKDQAGERRGLLQDIRRLAASESEWVRLIAYTAAYYGFMENPLQVSYRNCRTIDQVCDYLAGLGTEFYEEVEEILASPYFYGFLYAIGYGEGAEELIEGIQDGKCHGDLELFFDFLEKHVGGPQAKDKLVDCYLRKGPWAHLYWWKNHLDLYQFHGEEATALRGRIEGMKPDVSSLQKVREQMMELEQYSAEFRKLFADNIFLAKMGLDRGRTGITSTHMEAYWHYEFYGKEAPIGFSAEVGKGEEQSLKAPYDEAMSYADSLIGQCGELKESFHTGDALLVKHNLKYIVLMVAQILLGIGGLIMKGMLFTYLEAHAPESWDWGLLENYASMILLLICLVLIALGAWRLFRILYVGKRKVDLAEFERITQGIQREKAAAGESFEQMVGAFRSRTFETVGNGNAWERSYAEFREKALGMGSRTQTWVQVISAGISFVALGCFALIFTPWIVSAVTKHFDFAAAFIVCSAYLILYELMNLSMVELARYQKKIAKPVMIGLFVFYQVIVGVLLAGRDGYAPILGGGGFLKDYLLTKGTIFLVVTTLLGVLVQGCTDLDRYLQWREKGYLDIEIGGDVVKRIYPIEKYATVLVGTLCLFATPFGTAYAFNGASFLAGVLVYLGIGVVWIGVLVLFSTQRLRYAAGQSLAWTRNAFYAAYFFLTIGLIPGFGIWTALLVVLHILAPVALGALISFLVALLKNKLDNKAPGTEETAGKGTQEETGRQEQRRKEKKEQSMEDAKGVSRQDKKESVRNV